MQKGCWPDDHFLFPKQRRPVPLRVENKVWTPVITLTTKQAVSILFIFTCLCNLPLSFGCFCWRNTQLDHTVLPAVKVNISLEWLEDMKGQQNERTRFQQTALISVTFQILTANAWVFESSGDDRPEAVRTSETSINFNVTTWRYIPQDSKPQH
jgi:hypothetical protein